MIIEQTATNHDTEDQLDAIENGRIEKDVREILGCLGTVEAYNHPGTDELAGWSIADGSFEIGRDDMPVDFAGTVEDACFVAHRQSLLLTIRQAYQVGRSISILKAADFNAETLDTLVGPDPSDPRYTWLTAMVDTVEQLEGAGKKAWEGDDPFSAGECLSECRRIVDRLRDILRPHLDQLAAEAEGRTA